MTEAELLALIAQDEGQHIEFKQENEKPSELAEVLQGFAHAEGGHLLVGVTDDGTIVGVNRPKIIVDRIRQAAAMLTPSLTSQVSLQVVPVSNSASADNSNQNHNLSVVVAYVPQVPDQLFMLAGGYHIRDGSRTVDMTPEELKRRMARSGQIMFENSTLPTATINDIDSVRFYRYMRKRTANPEGPGQLTDLLRRAELLTQDGTVQRPTIAALLLFGKNPQEFGSLFNARLKAARFAGNVPVHFLDEADFTGPIPVLLEEGLRFFRRNIRHPLIIDAARTGTPTSVPISEYPEDAMREVLVNALCHCDYYLNRPVFLKIFDDRIEVDNPGGLYQRRNLNELRGVHLPRNPKIANALHILGWVEQFGTGIYRIERNMVEAGLPAPVFEYDTNTFRVTLVGPGPNEAPNVTEATRRQSFMTTTANNDTGEKSDWVAEDKNASQIQLDITNLAPSGTAEERELHWLLERVGGEKKPATRRRQARATLYARNNGTINRTQYAQMNKISGYTATEELRELVDLGVFELIGSSRASAYRLTDYKPRD